MFYQSTGNAFDSTRRPWYARAIISKGKFAISTPYLDTGGAGLVNTISTAVFEEKDTEKNVIINDKVNHIYFAT